jgi:hypothetical protein
MVWNSVPKSTYVGLDILCLGMYDAIAQKVLRLKSSIRHHELFRTVVI